MCTNRTRRKDGRRGDKTGLGYRGIDRMSKSKNEIRRAYVVDLKHEQ